MTTHSAPKVRSASLPPTIVQLRGIEDVLAVRGVDRVSVGYPELFGQDERVLRLDGSTAMAFLVPDLRRLGADPRVGNLPTSMHMDRAFSGPEDDPVTPAERLNLLRLQNSQFFTADPKTHSAVKRIFTTPLMPKSMPPFAVIGGEVVRDLIERLAGTGLVDASADIALPMCYDFWARVLEMTPNEREALWSLVRRMGPIFGIRGTRSGLLDTNAAVLEYMSIFETIVGRALATGNHVYLNWMAQQLDLIDEPLVSIPENLGVFLASNMVDAFHAMAVGLTAVLNELLDDPQALDAIRADPGLAGAAVDEALRLYTPVPVIRRYLHADVDYDGLHLPAGSMVVLHWHAGNRDPAFCDEPNRFRLQRPSRPLLTFGTGAQLCPGRNVTRTLTVAAVKEFAAADVHIERAALTEWMTNEREPIIIKSQPSLVPMHVTLS